MSASKEKIPSPLGERILKAIEEEGRTQTGTERQVGYGTGHLHKIIYGERGTSTLDVSKMAALADLLHVRFEWLVLGRGPMRRDGREKRTPAEEAIHFARKAGAREDAIQAAWERLKNKADQLDAMEWALAIDAEARMLGRAGVPRPEEVTKKKSGIRRAKRKLERAKAKSEELSEGEPTAQETEPRRATSA